MAEGRGGTHSPLYRGVAEGRGGTLIGCRPAGVIAPRVEPRGGGYIEKISRLGFARRTVDERSRESAPRAEPRICTPSGAENCTPSGAEGYAYIYQFLVSASLDEHVLSEAEELYPERSRGVALHFCIYRYRNFRM